MTVADPNNGAGDTHTFDLNDLRFEVRNGNRLYLEAGQRLDFETEESVTLVIGATDRGGNRIERTFTLQVLDILDTPAAPTDMRLSNLTFAEGRAGQAVGFVIVDDPNPSEFFRFTASDPRFEVTEGILKLRDNIAVDFETEATVSLTLEVEDKDQLTLTRNFTLQVVDVDEHAKAPGFPADWTELVTRRGFPTLTTNGFAFDALLYRPGSLSGVSITAAGDFTHDGFEDLVIAAVTSNSPASFGHYAYLLPGGVNFPSQVFPGAPGSTTFSLPTTEDGHESISVAGIGDFNGDGFNDLAFGSGKAESSSGEFEAGQAMVVLGRAGGLPPMLNLALSSSFDGVTAFRVEGAVTHERLGTGIAAGGDLDGDGYHDVIIRIGSPAEFGDGGSLILYGRGATFPPTQTSDFITGLRYTRILSGTSEPIGDLNADGFDDLFVALPGSEGSGVVLWGQAGGWPDQLEPLTTHDILIRGGLNRRILNQPGVAGSAGDLNSDGFEDMFLVTHTDPTPVSLNNEIVLLFGGETFPETIDLTGNDGGGPGGVSPIAWLDDGTRGLQVVPGGVYGRSSATETSFVKGLVGCGDVNGDGNDDLLIRVANTTTAQHEHVLLFGNPFLPGRIVLDPAALPATQGLAFGFPIEPSYGLAEGLGGRADLNGDGFDELVLADPRVRVTFTDFASLVFVLYGADLANLSPQFGTPAGDLLLGLPSAPDLLIGGLGNDTLVGRGGRDVYYGGGGDDLIVITGTGIAEYTRIDGGTGFDTARLSGAGLVWDLGKTGNSTLNPAGNHLVERIEIIDLGRGGFANPNTVRLSADDLLHLPGEGRSLVVVGDAQDNVLFAGSLTLDRTESRLVPGMGLIQVDVYRVGETGFELALAPDIHLM